MHPRTWQGGNLHSSPSRTLGSTASAPGISPHGHGLSVALDVLEVGEGAAELPAVDGLGGLAGVLVRDAEVGAARAGGLGRLDVGGGVADLEGEGGVSVCGLLVVCDGGAVGGGRKNAGGAQSLMMAVCATVVHTILTDLLVVSIGSRRGRRQSQQILSASRARNFEMPFAKICAEKIRQGGGGLCALNLRSSVAALQRNLAGEDESLHATTVRSHLHNTFLDNTIRDGIHTERRSWRR